MRKISIPNIQNSRARRAANQIGEKIRSGEIGIGSSLSGRYMREEYHLGGNQITQVFGFLKMDGLIECKIASSNGGRGNRYFVKGPENPQGGSPERR